MDQYKLVVINSNGLVEKIGNRSEEELHIVCLLNYIKEKYSNNQTLMKLNTKHAPNTVGFFLTLYGKVIIFNTTKNEKKHGKSAFLMMPAVLTEEQRKSLEELLKNMSTYFLTIAYETKIVDGILEGKELSSTKKKPPIEVLEIFYNKMGIVQKKGDILK